MTRVESCAELQGRHRPGHLRRDGLASLAKRSLLGTLGARSSVAVVLAAAGCATDPRPSTADLLLDPAPGRSVLVIFRPSGVPDVGCVYRIAVDERTIAELLPGGWVTVYPIGGQHLVGVQLSGGTCTGTAQIRLRCVEGRDRRLQTTLEDGILAIRAPAGESLE